MIHPLVSSGKAARLNSNAIIIGDNVFSLAASQTKTLGPDRFSQKVSDIT
jgi:hypothetical protein